MPRIGLLKMIDIDTAYNQHGATIMINNHIK